MLHSYIDIAHAVHANMRSHTWLIFTIGKGFITSGSTKQKYNARASAESELNGVDDCMLKIK